VPDLGQGCTDGNPCTLTDACIIPTGSSMGKCVGSNPNKCEDNSVCTTDGCDPNVSGANPVTGCLNVPKTVGTACDDGKACTSPDACNSKGVCYGPDNCDDGNQCTYDFCAPGGLCINESKPTGTACVGPLDNCYLYGCDGAATKPTCAKKIGVLPKCYDLNGCTVDTCDEFAKGGACVHTPKDCDDGKECTTDSCTSSCTTGVCTGTCHNDLPAKLPLCSGSLPNCYDYKCDSAGNCVQGTGLKCADSSMCTIEACNTWIKGGQCTSTPKDCDDDKPCTDDSCALGTCIHKNDDTNTCSYYCLLGDHCSSGSCLGLPRDCDDTNPCTSDTCSNTLAKCVFTNVANGTACVPPGKLCKGCTCKAGVCTYP
jgi:hypothetical protein